jgi:hypothetical protein
LPARWRPDITAPLLTVRDQSWSPGLLTPRRQ